MKRWLPLLALLLMLALALVLGSHRALSWSALSAHHATLVAFVGANPALAGGVFMLVYAATVAAAVPGGAVLSLAGGVLFGTLLGSMLTTVGATMGAVALFLATRMALAEPLARRFAPIAARLRPGLERDGFSYLLALRLLSVTPFLIGNIAAGLTGMRLAPFTAATVLGLIPSTIVLSSAGASLGAVLASRQQPEPGMIFTPGVLLPLAGLACLALLPVAWRRWKGEHA